MKFDPASAYIASDLPSFPQWAKTVSDDSPEICLEVQIIWLPSLYRNFTLDTNKFRLRIPEGHPYFPILQKHYPFWIENHTALAVRAISYRPPRIQLETLEETQVDWEVLGEKGFKAKNFRGVTKRSSKKPDI